MLKRILCLFAALLLLAGLSACIVSGDGKDETAPSAGVSDEITTGGEVSAPPEPTEPVTGELTATAAPAPGVTAQTPPAASGTTKPGGTAAKPVTTTKAKTTKAPATTKPPTTNQSVPQVATYTNTAFYKAVKAKKFYFNADNTSVKNGKTERMPTIYAMDSQKAYLKTEMQNIPFPLEFYTTDGKTLNWLLGNGKTGVAVTMPSLSEMLGKGLDFDSPRKDLLDVGTYQKTTTDGVNLIEHYKNGNVTKLITMKKDSSEIVCFETIKPNESAKSVFLEFSATPKQALFTKPLKYLKINEEQFKKAMEEYAKKNGN